MAANYELLFLLLFLIRTKELNTIDETNRGCVSLFFFFSGALFAKMGLPLLSHGIVRIR